VTAVSILRFRSVVGPIFWVYDKTRFTIRVTVASARLSSLYRAESMAQTVLKFAGLPVSTPVAVPRARRIRLIRRRSAHTGWRAVPVGSQILRAFKPCYRDPSPAH